MSTARTPARVAAPGRPSNEVVRGPAASRVVWPVLAVLVALAALLVALVIAGGAASEGAGDPGAVVRWGRPIATLVTDLAIAATLGMLVLSAWALQPGDARWSRVLDAAAGAAGLWTIASGAATLLAFLTLTDAPVGDERFGPQLVAFLSGVDLGRLLLAQTVSAALLTVLIIAVRSHTGVALVAGAGVLALAPLALQGHAAQAPGDHGAAIVALGMHVAGASVWLGGLGALLVLGLASRGRALADLASRYSTLALVAFVVVGFSGVVSAAIRLQTPAALLTPYGALVVVKSVALLVAGVAGALHRRVLLPRIATGTTRRPFLALLGGELLVLGVASGFAAALSASAPPDSALQVPSTPAEFLTGAALPPPMSVATLLTQWRPDPLWLLGCAFLAVLYAGAVLRLRRRGDRWPLHRTICWLAGVGVLAWLTSGGLNRYQEVLFSAHMLEHMALTMLVPLLLVPAAPVTLALRTIPRRTDGSRGGREWLLLAVHSRIAGVLSNPVVTAVLFAGSLIVFYYSPLFAWATTDHIGHEWMTAHFLVTGYLFVQSLVGVDPVPVRAAYPIRLLLLLATMAFHAFFGLSLILGQGLLLADWYGAMGWGTSALADQQAGGGIAWSVGEIPTLVLAVVVAVTWGRSDDKEAKRRDRAEDRSGDAELAAYNAMLARAGGRTNA